MYSVSINLEFYHLIKSHCGERGRECPRIPYEKSYKLKAL